MRAPSGSRALLEAAGCVVGESEGVAAGSPIAVGSGAVVAEGVGGDEDDPPQAAMSNPAIAMNTQSLLRLIEPIPASTPP
jgi:hypothetical protein